MKNLKIALPIILLLAFAFVLSGCPKKMMGGKYAANQATIVT